MLGLRRNILWTVAIAAALWVVPSLGTQGMGTIGHRFSHPDSRLYTRDTLADEASDKLKRADAVVEAAVERVH